jgi:bacterioferritin-associated ferredoxin
MVCACRELDETAVRAVLEEHEIATLGELLRRLDAPARCGRCVPRLRALLREARDCRASSRVNG